jgi:DNA-binding CsgD family transcriptional regulator
MEESPTRRAVRALTEAGRTPREIAEALGISTQRVHQQLQHIRKADAVQEKAS